MGTEAVKGVEGAQHLLQARVEGRTDVAQASDADAAAIVALRDAAARWQH
jgi:hypothetical protein